VLTSPQVQIARLVGEGHRNRDIAPQLFVSQATV